MKKVILAAAFYLVVLAGHAQTPAIHVEKSGKGRVIIFLPGFTTPGSVWKETIQHLEFKNESHLVSYAGFNKHAPIEIPWYETIKNELIAYVRKNNLKKISIVGHSMGGNLAVDLAAALPDRVERIILVDSLPCMRELMMPGVPAEKITYDNPFSKQMLAMNDEAFRQTAVMMAQGMTDNPSKIDTLAQWSVDADRRTYVNGYTDLLKLDLREVLPNITAKALILGAPFPDRGAVKTNLEKQYEKLANKTIEVAEKGKHFIMFDQPEWFYDKVTTFLSK